MKSDSGRTESIWESTADIPPAPQLLEDAQAHVCVIGAGIAGMSTAYLLGREGKHVIVLDDGPIGGGETGRTTAHLSNVLDDRYYELERIHGERGARVAAESHTAAVDKIEEIVFAEQIECEFRRLQGYLFTPPGISSETLTLELAALQRAGVNARFVDRAPIPWWDTGQCLEFPNQAQFHPVRYLAGLARAIERDGGKIYSRAHVEAIESGHPARIKVEGGRAVTANAVVVATNTPINDWVEIHTKQSAYRTYVIGALVPRASVPGNLYWDTGDPYHYARLQKLSEKHDVLIVGGEDHRTGQASDTEARFDRLEEWARERFPMIEFVEYRWSGQVMEPVDGLAFIGPNPHDEDNVFIATGDSGNGMTHGTIAGMLLSDLIQGRDNPWSALYDPARKSLRSVGEYTKTNLNVAKQYVDYVTGGDFENPDQIPQGHGAVLRRGLQKIAIFHDENGEFHEFSAVCPHLGCIVDWNATEQTWDCPCHGSRFSALGKVVNGPANVDLAPADDDEPRPVIPIAAVTP